MHSAWSKIEQDIGVLEIKVGKQIVIENVKLEAELTGTEPFLQRQYGPPMPVKYPVTSETYTEKIGRCQQCWKQPKKSFEGKNIKKRRQVLAYKVIAVGIREKEAGRITPTLVPNSSLETNL
jgi:hypothetical protein